MNNFKNIINVNVLYEATLFGDRFKEDIVTIAKAIGKFNGLSIFITKKREEDVEIDERLLINRDNILRSTVKKILYLNREVELEFLLSRNQQGMFIVTKKINKDNYKQCVELVDQFWQAMYEVADRKNKEIITLKGDR